MIELALAIVGFVVVYMNGPVWLRPPVRPFTCGYCMCWWLSWITWAIVPCWGTVVLVGITMAMAAAYGAAWPALMFDQRGAGPELQGLDDALETRVYEGLVDEPMPTDDRKRVPLVARVQGQALQGRDPRTVETTVTQHKR